MKGFRYGISIIIILTMSSAWALKTKFDPNIYVNELKVAGIRNVDKVKADLGLDNRNEADQELVVKHVITTGRDQADRNFAIINIDTLEKISPPLVSNKIISKAKQVALSNQQVSSIMKNMNDGNSRKKWMNDENRKKYINIVLQTKSDKNNKISPITTREAESLVKWAIKNKRLDEGDHPAPTEKLIN